jgi:excisionase family DNA binding protein
MAVLSCMSRMSIIETIESMDTALTVEVLGRLLSASPKTLYKAVKSGRLPAYRIGGSIRLDPFEVAQWLRARSTKN